MIQQCVTNVTVQQSAHKKRGLVLSPLEVFDLASLRLALKQVRESQRQRDPVPSRTSVGGRNHPDLAAFEFDVAVAQSKQRVVAATSDMTPGDELGSALADDDRPSLDHFATVFLNATILRVTVTTVTR